jgi:rhodanese-related sulfurtransferase
VYFAGLSCYLQYERNMGNPMTFRVSLAAAFAFVLSVFAVPMQPAAAQGAPAAQVEVPTISVSQFKALMKSHKRYVLVDVRTPQEFAGGHIDGAIPMPLDALPDNYKKIPKGVKLVVNCRSGHRSASAVQFLLAHGYKNAVSLDGGYLAWTAAP